MRRFYYYTRSICPAFFLAALAVGGCASASSIAASAHTMRYAELGRDPASASLGREPMVLAFVAGDRIPLDLTLESELVTQEPSPGHVEFVVTRPFFLLVRTDGPPRISIDGKDFDTHPQNTFRFGIRSQRGAPPRMEVVVGIRQKPSS